MSSAPGHAAQGCCPASPPQARGEHQEETRDPQAPAPCHTQILPELNSPRAKRNSAPSTSTVNKRGKTRKTQCCPGSSPHGALLLSPSKSWDPWSGVWKGESPGIGWSPARDIHCLWDCFEELLCFLKMKGMLEQPARGGVSVASRLGWRQVPGPISRVSPKPGLPSAAASMGEMRTGGMGACPGSQTQG